MMSRILILGLMMFLVFGLALCDDDKTDNANLLKTAGNINANANALVNGANALGGINANEANGANSMGANASNRGGISNPGGPPALGGPADDDANLNPLR